MVALWGMGRVGWTRRNSDFLLYTYVDRERVFDGIMGDFYLFRFFGNFLI